MAGASLGRPAKLISTMGRTVRLLPLPIMATVNSRPDRYDSTRAAWWYSLITCVTAFLSSILFLTIEFDLMPIPEPSLLGLTIKGKVRDFLSISVGVVKSWESAVVTPLARQISLARDLFKMSAEESGPGPVYGIPRISQSMGI